jgi:hypothetical protein
MHGPCEADPAQGCGSLWGAQLARGIGESVQFECGCLVERQGWRGLRFCERRRKSGGYGAQRWVGESEDCGVAGESVGGSSRSRGLGWNGGGSVMVH